MRIQEIKLCCYSILSSRLYCKLAKEHTGSFPSPQTLRPHIHTDCLNTRDQNILIKVLHILQLLVKSDTNTADATRKGLVGRALVPYYRQLLPVLNIFCEATKRQVTDKIEYSQRRGTNVQDTITETLGMLEEYGGMDAFINIKYLIPTYQSVMAVS